MGKGRARLTLTIRSVVSILLIGVVLQRSGVFDSAQRADIGHMLAATDLRFLLASLLIPFALNFASALKWHMLLKVKAASPGLGRLYAFYMVGQFFNMVLPTSMGGDVVRIHELGRAIGNRSEAIASVFVERFTGLITLIVIAALAVLVNLRLFNDPLISVSLAAFSALIVMIGWLVLDARALTLTRRLMPDTLAPLLAKLESIQAAVHDYRRNANAMSWAAVNSLIFYVLAILNVWFTGRAFDPSFSLLSALVVTPVIMLIMNLPISVGNLGLLEFAFMFTFERLGFPATLGFSAAFLMRFKTLIDAGLGAMLHPVISRGRSIQAEIREEDGVGSPMCRKRRDGQRKKILPV